MPRRYEAMRDKFAKGAKKDSPEYNAAQERAAKIYNASRKPNEPKLSNRRHGQKGRK